MSMMNGRKKGEIREGKTSHLERLISDRERSRREEKTNQRREGKRCRINPERF